MGEFDKRFTELLELCPKFSVGVGAPRGQIQRHLIVPAPPGVQLLAGFADFLDQRRLDAHVHVFEVDLPAVPARDVRRLDLIRFLQPPLDLRQVCSEISPTCWSIRAWAIEPAMSCLYIRVSYDSDSTNLADRSSASEPELLACSQGLLAMGR
jgi:hypothetical protein